MQATDIIGPGDVLLDVKASSKPDLLRTLAQKAATKLGSDAAVIHEALSRREALGSTGVGQGVAMPHAPLAGLTRPFGLIARLAHPLAFDAIDARPVDIICLLLTPAQAAREHVTALACVARRLRSPTVQAAIRDAATPAQLCAALAEPG